MKLLSDTLARVKPSPTIAVTNKATEMAQMIRPRVMAYVEALAQASRSELRLKQLPQDAKTLAFLVAIALQVNNSDKQELLELPGIPQMLAKEAYMLSREIMIMRYMAETQIYLESMSLGPTGYIFPN